MYRHDVVESGQDVVLAQQRAMRKDTLHPEQVRPTGVRNKHLVVIGVLALAPGAGR